MLGLSAAIQTTIGSAGFVTLERHLSFIRSRTLHKTFNMELQRKVLFSLLSVSAQNELAGVSSACTSLPQSCCPGSEDSPKPRRSTCSNIRRSSQRCIHYPFRPPIFRHSVCVSSTLETTGSSSQTQHDVLRRGLWQVLSSAVNTLGFGVHPTSLDGDARR